MEYTPEQLRRRDKSIWTPVQGVAAAIQVVVFVLSIVLVVRYLRTGEGFWAAHYASTAKVFILYFMTVTGMFWEKEVFDHYFMAKEFFWEDFVNLIALFPHTAYLVAHLWGADQRTQMIIMCVAFLTYLVNFAQFAARGARSAQQRRLARANGTFSTAQQEVARGIELHRDVL